MSRMALLLSEASEPMKVCWLTEVLHWIRTDGFAALMALIRSPLCLRSQLTTSCGTRTYVEVSEWLIKE